MPQFFDYNAERGTWYEDDWDHGENKFVLHTKQDVAPVLDYAKDQRNSGINDKVGDFCLYAVIPAVAELQMRERGIDFYNKHQTKEVIRFIEQEAPNLKCTNLRHG